MSAGGSSASPRPRPTSGRGSTCSRAALGAAHGARGRRDRALRGRHRPRDRARPAQPVRARVRGAAPARRLRVHDPLGHPALRRARDERGGVSSPGWWPPTRSSSSAPTCSAEATRLEGHPDNVAAALLGGFVLCADGARDALRRRRRASRPCSSSRARPCARPRRAPRCRAEVPMADAVFNVAHARAARARPGARRPRPRRPRARRPPAPAAPRAPVPALDGARRAARGSSARSARRSPAPARPCSCGATRRDRARSPTRLRGATPTGWARGAAASPFEPAGRRVVRSDPCGVHGRGSVDLHVRATTSDDRRPAAPRASALGCRVARARMQPSEAGLADRLRVRRAVDREAVAARPARQQLRLVAGQRERAAAVGRVGALRVAGGR